MYKNHIEVIGFAGQDAETKTTTTGRQFTRISVATTDRWKDKNTGERQERTEWHNVIFWGQPAKAAADMIKKGSHVLVEGPMRAREYTDRDGIKRKVWEIRGEKFLMLDARQAGPDKEKESEPPTDDIPFGGE